MYTSFHFSPICINKFLNCSNTCGFDLTRYHLRKLQHTFHDSTGNCIHIYYITYIHLHRVLSLLLYCTRLYHRSVAFQAMVALIYFTWHVPMCLPCESHYAARILEQNLSSNTSWNFSVKTPWPCIKFVVSACFHESFLLSITLCH